MKFEKVLEEVDVNQLTGKKENLTNQLDKVSQQEQADTQKAIDAVKQKYMGQKTMLSKQIQGIDQSVAQTATTLQQQQKQQGQTNFPTPQQPAQQPAQAPVRSGIAQQPVAQQPATTQQPILNANKKPAPAVPTGGTPVSPA